MSEPLLSVRDLQVDFHVGDRLARAVDGVSFDLFSGEVLAVVGESGCGKSVTALSVMRLVPQPPGRVSGEVGFEGRDLLRIPEREMERVRGGRIAMVFQDPLSSLNPVMTIGYQVAEAIALHQKVPMKLAWERAIEMLGRVGLPDPEVRAHSYPHQVSGGQRQRVMIAMAFACNPEVVIADEPTTALDVTVQRQVLDLMLELRRERGTSILLITHDLGVVAETADRVQVMYAGKVVETGTVFEIFDDPQHPYTRALLASVPRLEGDRLERLPAISGQPPDLLSLPPGCPFQPRCPLAHDRCVEMPGWTAFSPTHRARCWAAEEGNGRGDGEIEGRRD
ncbi:MAG TPA: ABC transporter ATP-binding protein [Armatimonadota bacterium]|nr:ABC transporter ATP-binding protein [Armatimonadota bacterium]